VLVPLLQAKEKMWAKYSEGGGESHLLNAKGEVYNKAAVRREQKAEARAEAEMRNEITYRRAGQDEKMKVAVLLLGIVVSLCWYLSAMDAQREEAMILEQNYQTELSSKAKKKGKSAAVAPSSGAGEGGGSEEGDGDDEDEGGEEDGLLAEV
jgi:hypothetical protein